TDLYAIPEMIKDGYNGYLHKPKWYFFDKNNNPNPKVWNHREETIYNTNTVDDNIIDFSVNNILKLNNNRNLLLQISLNALNTAKGEPFSSSYIKKQWELSVKKLNKEK